MVINRSSGKIKPTSSCTGVGDGSYPSVSVLTPHLDRLFAKFDPSFLEPDPLAAVNHFKDPLDLEVACLIAALFAYGRANQIQKNVKRIVESMEQSPASFCTEFIPAKQKSWNRGFVYRFNRRDDLVSLVRGIGRARNKYGSLKKMFISHDNLNDGTIFTALCGFVHELRILSGRSTKTFKTLLADPKAGGASKRWNLYLRWMVRKDGVDPGPWSKSVSAARLVIPLDVHVCRIARRIGILKRKSPDWKAAMEITRFLRKLDADDPIKYDFALCSYGKLGYCVKEVDKSRCGSCELSGVCDQL